MAAQVKRLNGKHFSYIHIIGPRLFKLLIENRELRIQERSLLTFIFKISLGNVRLSDFLVQLHNEASPEDLNVLYQTMRGSSRPRRIRSLIVILHLYGIPKVLISDCLGVCRKTVKSYIRYFKKKGTAALFPTRRGKKCDNPDYKVAIFEILHAPPKLHGFNRTTWRLRDLATCMARRGLSISKNKIGIFIREAGYRYMKAREVLTSNDPDYREKLDYIHQILENLESNERFFSIDEFGPVAIKHQTGRRLVGPGVYPTVPQFQKSKGCLIVTAALELSQNQVTHFYSTGKNTAEMIKLLEILLGQYRECKRLYFSWDAAGWHESKKFMEKIREINSRKFRKAHGTPIVELAPLPARAQFLNVIESIFNGLAISVIHNSNYASVDKAKTAIDRYFKERNVHFQKNPKRAGNKIWGKERVPSTFKEGQCCKHPDFR